VLLYHNTYHPTFGDQKISGLEIILHGERIATNGDVRLHPTPEQWDPIPTLERRESDAETSRLSAVCSYGDSGLKYRINVTPEGEGFRVALQLDAPLPEALVDRAALSLEFLPTTYFEKTYRVDDSFGVLPRYPTGRMLPFHGGTLAPTPLASGERVVLAPEDPKAHVEIRSESGPIALFDGRSAAQNGWFVIRTLIPEGKVGEAVVWHVQPHRIRDWTRTPVIAHSQVGYEPGQAKVAVIELDPLFAAPDSARVLKLDAAGQIEEVHEGAIAPWGKWTRYNYAHFDFSTVTEPGTYILEYSGVETKPFIIASQLYATGVWQPSLDTFLPVQMDHMRVREGYRIWHDSSHMDDARQAPVNHVHFDGYEQGPSTESPFQPGEHMPGLNRGGWYDAGDFDIRTQTQASTITDLVLAVELFGLSWDETSVDRAAKRVTIRRPDGIPDALQQIEHGVIALLAQYDVVGHAIPGIVAPTLEQYTHLGDGGSKTDNLIYDESMSATESDGVRSGLADDRWAFTNRATALEYRTISALAAGSRVLGEHDAALAARCLETAQHAWEEEQAREPSRFRSFNTTGGHPLDEEVRAVIELLIATDGADTYAARLGELLPGVEERFDSVGWTATRALPFMDESFGNAIESFAKMHKGKLDERLQENPFGVPIGRGGWGGAGGVVRFAAQMYFLHRAFPEVFGPEYTLRGLEYVLGRHPVSDISLVSGVGTRSKLIAYGANRADYSFIPGGLVPGLIVVRPDFPQLTEEWPFLWFENEYVIDTAAAFILVVNAAQALVAPTR
jgi:hypothetical protein